MILQPDCMRLLIRDVKLKTHSNERPNFARMIESVVSTNVGASKFCQ